MGSKTNKETQKIKIRKIEVIVLAYADDKVVLENSRNKVTKCTMTFLETGKIMGLEVNQEKTNILFIYCNLS